MNAIQLYIFETKKNKQTNNKNNVLTQIELNPEGELETVVLRRWRSCARKKRRLYSCAVTVLQNLS